jgi:hypothetical protein
MMRLMISLIVFSLVGCTSVQRPDALICGVNSKGMKLRCYNIKSDFSRDGVLKPEAKPQQIKINSIHDLNAGIYMSPSDFELVKIWIGDMRNWVKEHCQ